MSNATSTTTAPIKRGERVVVESPQGEEHGLVTKVALDVYGVGSRALVVQFDDGRKLTVNANSARQSAAAQRAAARACR